MQDSAAQRPHPRRSPELAVWIRGRFPPRWWVRGAWQGGSAGVGAHVLEFVCVRKERATRASALTGGDGAVPSYAQVRALIKPVLELCPCRCVETAMITPEKAAKSIRKFVPPLEMRRSPPLFGDLFCISMKQVSEGLK